MFSRAVLPALAVLSVVAAQTPSLCSQSTATINSQADATQYASCSTIEGDVLIGPEASGVISIDGPQQVTGSMICENAGALTSFGSSTIGSIGKEFLLTNLTLLADLSFRELQQVGSIKWSALQALPALNFPAVISKAANVLIQNTFLSDLTGINLATVATLEINNNNRLRIFNTQVANVTQLLKIDSNGRLLDVSFPNLIWAFNMTMRNVSTLSIPSLTSVNGSLGFYDNYFTSVVAPNLTSVGNTGTNVGSLAFISNNNMDNISMPLLTSVGGANQVTNNDVLRSIDYSSLQVVGGSIDISGNFETLSMGMLTNVKGIMNIQSTKPIDCKQFDAYKSSGVVQGKETCKSSASNANASGTTSSPSSSTSKKSVAGTHGINKAVAGLTVIGGLLQIML